MSIYTTYGNHIANSRFVWPWQKRLAQQNPTDVGKWVINSILIAVAAQIIGYTIMVLSLKAITAPEDDEDDAIKHAEERGFENGFNIADPYAGVSTIYAAKKDYLRALD